MASSRTVLPKVLAACACHAVGAQVLPKPGW
jgi:hypothetical protein